MSLDINFFGATDTVTGSLTLITINGKKYLVDCGQFQGPKDLRARNRTPFPFNPSDIEGVILTHAHLDHIGRLPMLCKGGFAGPIYLSKGSADLGRIILLDSAHLEQEFAKYANETGYSHHKPAMPLFTTEDAEQAISQFQVLDRNQWHSIGDTLSVKLLRSGHIVGSSLVVLRVQEGQRSKLVCFTGDLGRPQSITLKAPDPLPDCDYLVLESTYGGRLHPKTDPLEDLARVINAVAKRQGVLVIPAFAVGRSQDIIFSIKKLEEEKRIPTLPVSLDSPMATSATEVFLRHGEDQKALSAFQGYSSFFPKHFETATTADESMLLCMKDGPHIVISASGMLAGGRILHHLKARLPYEANEVLFCGYQAEGSKGRFLQENQGVKTLRIHHKETPIEAKITTLDAYSAHGDYQEILQWLQPIKDRKTKIILNHGSPESQQDLAGHIKAAFGIDSLCSCETTHVVVSTRG